MKAYVIKEKRDGRLRLTTISLSKEGAIMTLIDPFGSESYVMTKWVEDYERHYSVIEIEITGDFKPFWQ